MSITWTRQVRRPGASGTHAFEEGDGMHSRVVYDGAFDLNNIRGYCAPLVGFCQSGALVSTIDIAGFGDGAGNGEEVFLDQTPTLVPSWARRMAWTAGLQLYSGGVYDVDSSSLHVYLASREYVGVGSGSILLDTDGLPTAYKKRSKAAVISVNNAVSSYLLVEDLDGLEYPPSWWEAVGTQTRSAILVVSATVDTDCAAEDTAQLWLQDFTWWFLPE